MIWLLLGCVSLDTFVHNPVHCSWVDEATCDKNAWDAVCLTCEQDYVWDEAYDWIPGTLAEGESVRPIDVDTVEPLRLPTMDGQGELDLYFVPGHGDNARITVIYSHGNYAGLEHYMPRVRFLHEGGYSVLFWDYRGYGKSEPAAAPTSQQWLQDARQVRNVAEDFAPDPTRIVLYANSVGGIPAVEQALYAPGCALVLEAPFTGISAITRDNAAVDFPASYLTYGDFENTHKIADYAGPLFTMIGTEDEKFTVEEVTLLHDNAGTPAGDKELWVLDGVAHGISGGGIPEAGLTPYLDRMGAFLQAHCGS